MKALKFAGLVALALTLSTRLMAQDNQTLTIPLSDPGKPYKLNVDMVFGSIKVTAHEGKDVIIEAQAQAPRYKHEPKESNGMRRISSGENMDVVAREKNNAVNISNNMPNKNVNLDIRIPRGATIIKLQTVNGGNIIADGISGDIEASNTNGGIKLTNISGSAVANTTNGNVQVTFKTLDNKAALAFTSLNGNVDVTFPDNFKANLKARSDQGNVFTDFDMVTEKSPSKSTKTAKDGMYRITIEDWVYGKINGGGPELLMKTMNGNIYIRKAK